MVVMGSSASKTWIGTTGGGQSSPVTTWLCIFAMNCPPTPPRSSSASQRLKCFPPQINKYFPHIHPSFLGEFCVCMTE